MSNKSLRILMWNRPNALTQRGGDTIVMERLSMGLRESGVMVDIDLDLTADPKSYDLVHIYNFALPELTTLLAERVYATGVPYVVTTLYEDWPRFFKLHHYYANLLIAYVERGQGDDLWNDLLQSNPIPLPVKPLDNYWTAEHAARLLVNGVNEGSSLLKDYGNNLKISINHFGSDLPLAKVNTGSDLLNGEKDFLLCVGRLEARKNQLMLLKAFEHLPHTLVFVAGGFTYQPEYAEACRNFKRVGKTIFLDRISDEQLAELYQSARLHVLPSWYELPGLVSLEAAAYGTPVVVTREGTAEDYFGSSAFYVRPDSPQDILNGVLAALNGGGGGIRDVVAKYTWENSVRELLDIYADVI